jgi:hypothetical protein
MCQRPVPPSLTSSTHGARLSAARFLPKSPTAPLLLASAACREACQLYGQPCSPWAGLLRLPVCLATHAFGGQLSHSPCGHAPAIAAPLVGRCHSDAVLQPGQLQKDNCHHLTDSVFKAPPCSNHSARPIGNSPHWPDRKPVHRSNPTNPFALMCTPLLRRTTTLCLSPCHPISVSGKPPTVGPLSRRRGSSVTAHLTTSPSLCACLEEAPYPRKALGGAGPVPLSLECCHASPKPPPIAELSSFPFWYSGVVLIPYLLCWCHQSCCAPHHWPPSLRHHCAPMSSTLHGAMLLQCKMVLLTMPGDRFTVKPSVKTA